MSTLGTFVFVIVFISYSYQDLIAEDVFIKARADCQKETGVADELINKAEIGEFPDDKDFKCFVKCFHTQVGYLNDDGEPQLEIIKENLPEVHHEKANKILLEKCKDIQGDPCEKAFALHKCYYEQMHTDL